MSETAADAPAEAHCADAGGTVVLRAPVLAGDALLGAPRAFCEFAAAEGGAAKPGSRISVLADALASPLPSQAALAYRARTPMPALDGAELQQMVAGPGAFYCRALGGIPGRWALAGDADEGIPGQVDFCVFPDLSAVDVAALLSGAMGDMVGADLGARFAWQPAP